jgi:hypothetical protein
MPIALTDVQMDGLMVVARQLPRHLRDDYLRTIAALLQGREVSDATVHRACARVRVSGSTAPRAGKPISGTIQ